MTKKLLTEVTIRALKAEDKQYDIWDTKRPGLSIRVSPGGTKTFCFSYRFNGGNKRIKIGR